MHSYFPVLAAAAALFAIGIVHAQQPRALDEEQLRTECLRLFDTKRYAGNIE